MGQRISFFKNNFDKGLKDLLIDNYSKFRQWYLDFDKSSMTEFNEPFGNEIINSYFNEERNLQVDFENSDKQLIDLLTSEFIGSYCDLKHHQSDIFEFFGPAMSTWRYKESHELVFATRDDRFIELWHFITNGRSLKDKKSFENFSNGYKIGFIDREEYLALKSKIEFHFGDIQAIRQKYWTSKERAQLEKALSSSKNGSYSLAGHNPISSGLEYVLSALCELTDKNKELLTAIE